MDSLAWEALRGNQSRRTGRVLQKLWRVFVVCRLCGEIVPNIYLQPKVCRSCWLVSRHVDRRDVKQRPAASCRLDVLPCLALPCLALHRPTYTRCDDYPWIHAKVWEWFSLPTLASPRMRIERYARTLRPHEPAHHIWRSRHIASGRLAWR